MTELRADERPACDLVMKGGVTSGIVFPRLIASLARVYRFHSIGGTSAGAIAAAACAAAEYGRSRGGKPDAFDGVGTLPEVFASASGKPRRSRLFHLFQPVSALRDHFIVLTALLEHKNPLAAAEAGMRALFARFPGAIAVAVGASWLATLAIVRGVLPGRSVADDAALAIAMVAGWALALVLAWRACRRWRAVRTPARTAGLALLLALALSALLLTGAGAPGSIELAFGMLSLATMVPLLAGLAISLSVVRFGATLLAGLAGNFWGMCRGRSETDDVPAALTDWLTAYLNGLAGMAADARPITFGDLWGADMTDLVARPPDTPLDSRALDLRVMTTAVSQTMCYAIPFREDANLFYYDPAEWASFFPPTVMGWLERVHTADTRQEASEVRSAADRPLRRLPAGRYLPLVVAVRMSLSFPILLSAVPLYAIDRSVPEDVRARRAKRVWFSDGGIASNMPLHFFDAPLPSRPTFAINLKESHPAYPVQPRKRARDQAGRVYLADNERGGRAQYWRPPIDEGPAGLYDFLTSIVETMRTWRDHIQFPYPGYRDRIVQISLLPDEGGLNLRMPKSTIDALCDAGECAAERILERFGSASGEAHGEGWSNHREIRLRTFLARVQDLLTHPSMLDDGWERVAEGLRDRGIYDDEQHAAALAVLRSLRALGDELVSRSAPLTKSAPRPEPQLQITPRI